MANLSQKILLVFSLLLLAGVSSACRRAEPAATASPVQPGATQAPVSTPYPDAGEVIPPETGEAYPAPPGDEPVSGYPAPATPVAAYPQPQATSTLDLAGMHATKTYTPAPGSSPSTAALATASVSPTVTAVPTVSATATVDTGYPPPEVPSISANQSTAYPQPGSATPSGAQPTSTPTRQITGTQPATATATPGSATPGVPTASPTITPTPSLVRTSQQVSDPDTFRLAAGRPQLLEFFATWSPLSNSMAPVLNNLDERYGDRILFTYLDVDDPANSLFKALLGERLPPVIYLLEADGSIIAAWQGYVPIRDLENAFSQIP